MNEGIKADTPDIFDVFISYASVDRDSVELLVRKLKMDKFCVWLDIEQIGRGPSTSGQLADGIKRSSHMIACLSDAYLERDFTKSELQINLSLDPANTSNRTIPVIIKPLKQRQIPLEINFFNRGDLTDTSTYDSEYQRITRFIQRNRPRPEPTEFDQETLQRNCEAPFKYLDDPNVALFKARLAAEDICKFLHRQELGNLPTNASLDSLAERLLSAEILPAPIKMLLSTVQRYGNFVVQDRMEDYAITQEFIQSGLAALKALSDWTLEKYFGQRKKKDLWESILEKLPAQEHPNELGIPKSEYILKKPKLSVNSLGPIYAGRDKKFNKTIAVNLVAPSEEHETAFFEEAGQFIRLNNASIVRPLDAGKIVVNDRRLCLYVIFEHVDGASGQMLVEFFGKFPKLAACELCYGVAVSLEVFHAATPMIVHGDIKPANTIVDRFGAVKVLCIGRNTNITAAEASSGAAEGKIDSFLFASPEQLSGAKQLTPKTDLFALRAMLFYLLTGKYESRLRSDDLTPDMLPDGSSEILEKLAVCTTAKEARSILEAACQKLAGKSVNLRTAIDCYREDKKELPPEPPPDSTPEAPPENKPVPVQPSKPKPLDFSLHTEFPIECRNAWPLGDGRILVWETGADTLAILEGSELLWRDSRSIQLRKISRGSGNVLAATSWEGEVRCFADGKILTAVNLAGTVGDIQFCNDRWLAGTWKHALVGITMTGAVITIFNVEKGVFRIAVMDEGERYAVADLGSGISFYLGNVKTAETPPLGNISSMAFAGKHLMVISGRSLITVNLDGTVTRDNLRETGALRLLPSPYSGRCLLMTEKGDSRLIDESGIQQLYFSFPAGHDLLSFCRIARRFILALPGGGCAYWRNGEQQLAWPDAITANISSDGHFVAVTSPGKVQLYEDPK